MALCLSIWPACCLSVWLSSWLSVCLSGWMSGCLPACLPACLPDDLPGTWSHCQRPLFGTSKPHTLASCSLFSSLSEFVEEFQKLAVEDGNKICQPEFEMRVRIHDPGNSIECSLVVLIVHHCLSGNSHIQSACGSLIVHFQVGCVLGGGYAVSGETVNGKNYNCRRLWG